MVQNYRSDYLQDRLSRLAKISIGNLKEFTPFVFKLDFPRPFLLALTCGNPIVLVSLDSLDYENRFQSEDAPKFFEFLKIHESSLV